jgi:hypothetical protein
MISLWEVKLVLFSTWLPTLWGGGGGWSRTSFIHLQAHIRQCHIPVQQSLFSKSTRSYMKNLHAWETTSMQNCKFDRCTTLVVKKSLNLWNPEVHYSNTKAHQRTSSMRSTLTLYSFELSFSHLHLALQTPFQTITIGPLLVFLCTLHVPCSSSSLIGHPYNIWPITQIIKLLIMQIPSYSYYVLSLVSKQTNCTILPSDCNKCWFTCSEFFCDKQ